LCFSSKAEALLKAFSAQTGHRFGFRLIVEEGLSHAVLTQTQGCEPVIVNPNGYFILQKDGSQQQTPILLDRRDPVYIDLHEQSA
jgi:hypothetical protein